MAEQNHHHQRRQVMNIKMSGSNSEFSHVSCHAEDQVDLPALVRHHMAAANSHNHLHARQRLLLLVEQQALYRIQLLRRVASRKVNK